MRPRKREVPPAGADSIDDLDVVRQSGTTEVFGGVRAPCTYGTFLRAFTFGHVRRLDAMHSRSLVGRCAVRPRLLAGRQAMAFVDLDDPIREVHRFTRQGAARGYSGINGRNAQIAVLSSPTCAACNASTPPSRPGVRVSCSRRGVTTRSSPTPPQCSGRPDPP